MSPVERQARLELLLAHAAWIRSLARELVRDPALAEEIEQRTLIAALSHAPRAGVPFASWLGTVARNFVRQHRRSEGRRVKHEERAARSEATPSAADVVERAAVQRELVQAVMELDEPFRTTILLRFYEGLPPRDVARRMDVPVETVRTRTTRGLALLRERLDRHHGGGRAAWLGALVPLTRFPASPLGLGPAGIGIMNTKWKVAAALAVVLGIAAIVWTRGEGRSGTQAKDAERAARLQRPDASSASNGSSGSHSEEPRLPAARANSGTSASTSTGPALVRGKVLDATGRPLAGVRVGVRGERGGSSAASPMERALATSADDGSFSFPAQPGAERVVDCEERWTTVIAGKDARGEGRLEQVLVLARPRALAATVVDALGAPVAGARVHVRLAASFRTRLREVLDASASLERDATSGADGAFFLDDLPDLADVELAVRHDAYLPIEARLVDLAPRTVITLTRPSASAEGVLRGKVVDPAGRPVPSARVAFGIDTRTTDDEGAFSFLLDDPQSLGRRFSVVAETLTALAPGFQLASFTPPFEGGKVLWPAFVTLQLGAPPLSIEGRVLGVDGAPLAGASVWIMDAQLFGGDERGALFVENLLAAGAPDGWRRVETDAEGRFALDGLLDHDYHVEAMDRSTLLRVQEGPFRAGARDAVLRMPKDALHPRVAGRVLSRRGAPIAGARVYPMCDGLRERVKGKVIGTHHDALQGVITDASGHFELADLPKELVYLRIDGEDVLPLEYGRDGEGDDRFAGGGTSTLPSERVTELEIVVDQRCHLQVVLSDPSTADEVALLDAQGGVVPLNVYDGHGRETRDRYPLTDGRSPALAVSDAGTTIVLYEAGVEVLRMPVVLAPGPLKEVRL
ncbi:MAG: sigma-70 family RNA polymerase sigma factor [Planctomycetes bacterium]|nr:sigma-70 family RNA polymerase sigma factor [Planctomycetota bacterium]